jgi:hypothetical protein
MGNGCWQKRKKDKMNAKPIEQNDPIEGPNAVVEKALIQEFLKEQGYSLADLKTLPTEVAEKLMKAASRYASLKMEEVEARAHFVQELHNDASSLEKK